MSIRSSGVAPAILVALVAGSTTAMAGTWPHTTISLTAKDDARGPGMGAGVTFTTLGGQQPTINSSGNVAFRGITSADVANQGLWIFGGGSNSLVAIHGGAQPGGGTYTTTSPTSAINSMIMADGGQWAFRLGASTGAFATNAGVPTRSALTLDVAPGTGGATYASLLTSAPRYSNSGRMAFLANLTTSTGTPPVLISGATANLTGLWAGMPGSESLVLRRNDALLSLDATGEVRVGAINNLSLSINDHGAYLLTTTFQGASVVTGTGAGSNSAAMLTNRSGSLEVIARVGTPAPDATGAPSSDLYRSIGSGATAFNNAGRVAFTTPLRDAAGIQTYAGAFFADTVGGTLRLHARVGDAMPAINGASGSEFSGVTWGQTYSNISLNRSGTVVFSASGLGNTGGTTNTGGIFTMDATGAFSKVVRAGDVAIVNGAPLGGDALFQNNFSGITINGAGQVAFLALLSGAGIAGGPGGNNSGLFAWDPGTGFCLIARTSDPFQVAPGDVRTVNAIGGIISSGGQDGRGRSLSDSGVLVFELDFTDGTSGIFATSLPSHPPCPADLANSSGNGIPDGGVDVNDLLYFLAAFEAGNAAADLDNGTSTGTPDGGVDVNDLLFYLAHFEAGC